MSRKSHFVAALLTSLVLSALIVFVLHPTSRLSPGYDVGLVFLIQIIAFGLAWVVGRPGLGYAIVKALIVSFALAVFIVYLLVPAHNPGFSSLFLTIFGIEAVGQGFALLLVRKG